ncbi:hypothetical protein GCM10008090_09490 [Arenicella chitinivorans]|uniref:CBS domain-containing protein n=1 Tax=Arenicella chitinivorans TaxID=1329800 RepID=A0A918RM05_9GAMM|nr:CBS domain-containing protein [Arenicella chitinivorans]GHA02292.1 hypothetical protein GCM10008090_09490 [Arenicella chitinivorans]
MLRSVEMKDYMSTDPVKVKPEDDIFEAIHQLLVYRVSGACVVNDGGYLVGILSELDCLRAILGATYNKSPVGKVSEYMTREVISVKLSDNIVDVATDMMLHKHRRRPVIQDDGMLIGQVTCRQLLRGVKDFATDTE